MQRQQFHGGQNMGRAAVGGMPTRPPTPRALSLALGFCMLCRSSGATPEPCHTSGWEPRLTALVPALFSEGLVQAGSIVDCGAHTGGEACFYASLDASRSVFAIEPLIANVKAIAERYRHIPNLHTLHAGLGSVERTLTSGSGRSPRSGGMLYNLHTAKNVCSLRTNLSSKNVFEERMHTTCIRTSSSKNSFRVHRLDTLFSSRWRSERLAFAHFDVEGAEADVLLGGLETIQRDRPVFTVEVSYHETAAVTRLFDIFREIRYHAYVVHEVAGVYPTLRNLVCIPSERQPSRALANSSTTALAANASHLAALCRSTPFYFRGALKQPLSVAKATLRTKAMD